jgi:hypothetical protein
MCHPKKPGWYYNSTLADWVEAGTGPYTTWQVADWMGTFKTYVIHPDGTILDDQGRLWERFGWQIPLYEEGEGVV